MGKYHRQIHAVDGQMPSHTEHGQNNKHQQPPGFVSSYAEQNMACSRMANPGHHSQCPGASLRHFPA